MFGRLKSFINETRGQAGGGLIGIVIAFILAFYVLSSTYDPLDDAAVDLNTSLAGSSFTAVQGLADLSGTAVLLFVLVTIFGLIVMAVRGSRL